MPSSAPRLTSPVEPLITALTLTDFRSYGTARLEPGAGPVVLHGPNGAGKTNLLEALSLLTPGKGLRGATAAEMGRREPGEASGRPWAVTVELDDDTRLGTGVPGGGGVRRIVRINGETAQPGRLLEYLRPVWATPEQDRLFSDARADRLRFYDRLVFAALPDHAAAVAGYDKALRERLRLLVQAADGGEADPLWLDALEARLAEAGTRIAEARVAALATLQAAIDGRGDRPFPQADLGLAGEAEERLSAGTAPAEVEAFLREGLARARTRDGAAGRSLFGPHRTDLTALHREKNRPAAEGSSGEQKALVLNLVLAQITRLANQTARPMLLLDEAPAHLDAARRAALFDEIEVLGREQGLQAFMTGTERPLFEGLEGRARFVRVAAGGLAED